MTNVHEGDKRISKHLELELQVIVSNLMYLGNRAVPIQEQQMLLTTELFLQSRMSVFAFGNVSSK